MGCPEGIGNATRTSKIKRTGMIRTSAVTSAFPLGGLGFKAFSFSYSFSFRLPETKHALQALVLGQVKLRYADRREVVINFFGTGHA